jgi:S1-C subfamily serine protease
MRKAAWLLTLWLAVTVSAADRPGWLGLSFSLHRSEKNAFLRLCAVAPRGPAARANLRKGDLITHINGQPLAFTDERAALLHFGKVKPQARLKLRVSRGTQAFDATVVAASMSDAQYRVHRLNLGAR